MADQGKWFKLWCSADDDPDLSELSLEDFGRWCKLGMYIKRHGSNGSAMFRKTARILQEKFRVTTSEEVIAILKKFPNCDVHEKQHPSIHDETVVFVSLRNWHKYQDDPWEGRNSGFLKVGGKIKSRCEHEFAKLLAEVGVEFKEQHRFPHGRTFYTVDFFLPSKHLAFEIQGREHASKKYRELDSRKHASLMSSYGVRVIAIDNTSILQNTDFVRRYIIECIEGNSTASSPFIRREEIRRDKKRPPTPTPSSAYADAWAQEPWPSVRRFVALYNTEAPDEWPSVELVSEEREKRIREYLTKFPEQNFWQTVFKQAKNSRFCRNYQNGGMDWLLQRGKNDSVENCLKVFEGKYADQTYPRTR